MKRWKITVLAAVGSLLLLAGFIVLLLPGIVRRQAVQRIEAATGRTLEIGGISLNPLTLSMRVRELRFSELGRSEPFVSFSSARIAMNPVSFLRRTPVIASARIDSFHLTIIRGKQGNYNFSDLLRWLPLHPRLSLSNLGITNGSLDFIDRGLASEQRLELRKVVLAVPFVSSMATYADRFVAPRLSAELNGLPLRIEGKLRPFPRPVEADATIEFKDVSLPYLLAYVPGTFPVHVVSGRTAANVALTYRKPELSVYGTAVLTDVKSADLAGVPVMNLSKLDVAAQTYFGGGKGMVFDRVSLTGRQLFVPYGNNEQISVASFTLGGGRYSRREHLLEVADVTLKNGDVHFSRNPKGALLPLDLLYKGGKGAAPGKGGAAPRLRYRIGRISGTDMTAVFTDEVLKQRPSFSFRQISISLENLIGPPFAPIPLTVAGRYGEEGTLRFTGAVQPTPWKLKGDLDVQRIPLAGFNAYLPENLAMVVASGTADTRLAVSLAVRGERMTGSFAGSAGIRSLYCLDAAGKEFLRWDSFRLDRMNLGLGSAPLDFGDVTLKRFSTRIAVERDGSLNIRNLHTRGLGIQEKKIAANVKRRTVRIGTVVMQDGTLVFSDRHVPGGYTTALSNMGGRISGLSSTDTRAADLELHGTLDGRSPLRISGRISPLRDIFFADLNMSFSDVRLPPLTPYSGTYLGYAVDRGQLFLDSTFRVKNRQLDMENRVSIKQLHFGKTIPSDQATVLPVHLAVEMLKDPKGDLRFDLPVTGRTDDPKFSAWQMTLDIMKNLIVTAARSPAALFRSMFGGTEDQGGVGFDRGPAEVIPGGRDKGER